MVFIFRDIIIIDVGQYNINVSYWYASDDWQHTARVKRRRAKRKEKLKSAL